MRPLLVLWLIRHGRPGWLAPTDFTLTVLSALIGGLVTLRLARADREDLTHEARSLALACLGAFTGGYALEALYALLHPGAVSALAPCRQAGPAASGGLFFALVLAVSYRVKHQLKLTAFVDRIMVGAGVAFLAARLGGFLLGGDYGIATSRELFLGLSRAQYVCVMVCTGVAGLLAQRCGHAVPGPRVG